MTEELTTIKLDKERHLRLTLKGILEFEKLTGKSFMKGFDPQDFSLEDTATMLWACLLHEDKELTLDDVLCMVDVANFVAVMGALTVCINQLRPGDKVLSMYLEQSLSEDEAGEGER